MRTPIGFDSFFIMRKFFFGDLPGSSNSDRSMAMSDPFCIQWHITNLCNLRCRHCYQDDFSARDDLDGSGLRKVADTILAAARSWNRTLLIHLTGGEPLLKEELFPLFEHLDRQPEVEELGLITNGLCLDRRMVSRLAAIPKLRKIKISLDGAESDINDTIRQQGTFKKVIASLPWIKEVHRFEIIFMFTVMKSNYQNLLPYLRWCEQLDVDGMILERFIPWGRGRESIDQVLGKEQWRELVETLFDFFSIERAEVLQSPHQAFHVCFRKDGPELLGAPCVIGTDGLCIMPGGDVFPCRRFPVSIGNLLGDSLNRIWREDPILEALREKKNLKGRCGHCSIEGCRGCRSLALSLTGDYLSENPHCSFNPSPL
jgi:radical SAM protein with 4Fe4S-binding SPASM domain